MRSWQKYKNRYISKAVQLKPAVSAWPDITRSKWENLFFFSQFGWTDLINLWFSACLHQSISLTLWVKRACGCMKLCCPLQQSPSCGAHWRAGLLVWPPYAGVWGPGCQRSSSTWRAVGGHMVWGVWDGGGGSRSTSIVPGGQELSRTQQESGGPFLKSDQLELLFSHPAHFILLYIFSSPSLFPLRFPPPLYMADWYSDWNVIFLCLAYETAFSPLLPHPTHSFH